MAWNPSPEVAVARDAATKLGEIAKANAVMCVVTYVTADGRMGYASYGRTTAQCAEARKLADKMYAAARYRSSVVAKKAKP